jgi:hypothetical protein
MKKKQLKRELRKLRKKYDELADAVRRQEPNSVLTRLVKPSKEEIEAAVRRLERLEQLHTLCEWDNFSPGPEVAQYRKDYNALLDEQGNFESKYY